MLNLCKPQNVPGLGYGPLPQWSKKAAIFRNSHENISQNELKFLYSYHVQIFLDTLEGPASTNSDLLTNVADLALNKRADPRRVIEISQKYTEKPNLIMKQHPNDSSHVNIAAKMIAYVHQTHRCHAFFSLPELGYRQIHSRTCVWTPKSQDILILGLKADRLWHTISHLNQTFKSDNWLFSHFLLLIVTFSGF